MFGSIWLFTENSNETFKFDKIEYLFSLHCHIRHKKQSFNMFFFSLSANVDKMKWFQFKTPKSMRFAYISQTKKKTYVQIAKADQIRSDKTLLLFELKCEKAPNQLKYMWFIHMVRRRIPFTRCHRNHSILVVVFFCCVYVYIVLTERSLAGCSYLFMHRSNNL